MLCSPEGIPLLLRDVDGYLRRFGHDLLVPLRGMSFLACRHIARYLPEVARPDGALRRTIAALLGRHSPANAALAVEAGCSVGPDLRTLRRHARHVIGLDLFLPALRVAHAHLRGQPVEVPVREEGHMFSRAAAPLRLPPAPGIDLVCGDALDPPVRPGSADMVLSVGLLDTVPDPLLLIQRLDALLRPGGLMLLASPFNWEDTLTPPARQLGGANGSFLDRLGSEQALEGILTGVFPGLSHGGYEVAETANARWRFADYARCEVTHDVYLIAAHKRGSRPRP